MAGVLKRSALTHVGLAIFGYPWQFRIRYGTSQTSLSNSVDVADAYTMQHTISNLSAGTYYFAVVAYDTQGRQSTTSNVGSKTIQ